MSRYEKQVVLITGCSSGIGRALAHEFQRRGHRCFPTARRPESLEELRHAGLDPVQLDVTDAGSIREAVSTAVDRAGRIDMLVNNAGFSAFGPLAEVPLAQARSLFETNVLGPLAMIQAVFPHMARQRWGRIVNVGSMVGVLPTPFVGAYAATKAALHMLSEVLRMETEPFGIQIVLVQPGAVRSDISKNSPTNFEQYASDASHYRTISGYIEMRGHASQVNPTEAGELACSLVQAITKRRVPRLVRLGKGTGFLPFLERLPGGMRDRLFTRRFGLDKIGAK